MLQLYLVQGAANGCLCGYHLSSRIYRSYLHQAKWPLGPVTGYRADMYAVQCFQIPRLAGLIIQRLVLRL
jgi:hypothetical protein